MRLTELIVFFLASITFISCSNCDVSEKSENKEMKVVSINEILLQKFGKQGNIIKNSSKNFALCINDSEGQNPAQVNKVEFFIFDFNTKEIIFEDVIVNANVKWESDNLIVVTRIPGIITKDDNRKDRFVNYKYDVILKKKI